jgi:hypothetical protein
MLSKSSVRARIARAKLEERRQVKRRLLSDPEATAEVVAVVGGNHWPATICNVSATGVSLLLDPRLPQDCLLTVELRSPDGSFACTHLAWVVHAAPAAQGQILHGCRFTQELGEEELRNLLT